MGDVEINTLAAVAVGWLLAQVTSVACWVYSRWMLRKGLLNELKDIDAQLERVLHIHARQIQIYALGGIEPSAALPAPNMYFHQYFKEAFPHLNREQRLSYQLIHSSVDSLNAKNESLAKWLQDIWPAEDTAAKHPDQGATLEQWGERVKVLYRLAATTRWHIRYHLENPKHPSMYIMGASHEEYLKYQEHIDREIDDIMGKARKLDRKEFEKTYDPSSFE